MDTFVTSTPVSLTESGYPSGIAGLLSDQVRSRPTNPAIFFGGIEVNYAQLGNRVGIIAKALVDAGIKYGDKVGVFFPNHPDFVSSFFAVLSIGATVVPINPLLKSEEIAHILSDSEASAVVVHEKLTGELDGSLSSLEKLHNVFILSYKESGSVSPRRDLVVTRLSEAALSSSLSDPLRPRLLSEGLSVPLDHLAVLVYTSGTTGKPKGAMLTHGNLLAAVGMKRSVLQFKESDRILAVLPLCHIYGLAVVMLGMISQGGAMVICDHFEPVAVLTEIQDKRVTVIPAVPAMYQFMAMELEKNKYDISSVRYGLSGAAPLDVELLQRLDQAFGVPILEGYALTETACIATITPIEGPRKPGSVGPKVPGVELYVVDAKLRPLPFGKGNVGQVAVKGPNVMVGYYKQPEATEECMKSGLFLTGDLAFFDEDGYLNICGRTKELIIRGGQNVYPREVETVIMRMESVLEVAVLGVPDKYMGERVKAVVVPKAGRTVTEEEVKDFCSQYLASYKVPRVVEFKDILPRNSTGKVLKRLLV
ncbi:MAG: long-chain-fatty-acid--CoA ligase [Candidatus Obscuribacterales bacterium]|nr:long-chain-fatty-acid--CoA ligase [Candidatus Obscuribacterales bacterium]